MNKKILVLGASGMLGNAVFRLLSSSNDVEVFGTIRSEGSKASFPAALDEFLITGVEADDVDSLARVFAKVKPSHVINCIGLVKQLSDANDPLVALPLNAILPHRLAWLCEIANARLIHISTDCVFSGDKGMYVENDHPDARDLYGLSKYLGEVLNSPKVITLRTSIIGHELRGNHSLINWFLSQNGSVQGYKNAIFSGLPTVELARVIRDFVLPNDDISGLYHVSTEPISKYELLKIVAKEYGKEIKLIPSEDLVINRSLDSSKFRSTTGYSPESWEILVKKMQQFQ